ncbi:hypothetical protein [Anaplasma marginale]|uniref:Outer membrane protein beta-barrel domain-containing protein n=1 Tax=Anaplasma marginale (strain Florida) TaxID=320483 RepID=B9KIL4_ANAMF|nr:hypothetical protein [Anaplasma marginale]AAV86621.1 hypothetical protein AM628 [Anaplasma marginale str. St. Maries]ACM49326.1 Conserved hypothetical protein [Anaplasma marginale str. Florida]
MTSYITRRARLFCYAALTTIALPCMSASATESGEGSATADLGIRLGMYSEGERFPLQSQKTDDVATQNARSYSALAGVRYVVTTKKLGNFSAEVGYAYRSEQLVHSYNFAEMKKRIGDYSSLYAEARWGTNGLLLVQNLGFSLGASIGGEKVDQGTMPVRFMGGFTYKVGGITSIYAGLQYVTHLQSVSPVSFSLEDYKGVSKYVVGVEFAV